MHDADAFAEKAKQALERRLADRPLHFHYGQDWASSVELKVDRIAVEKSPRGPGLALVLALDNGPGGRIGFRWTPLLDEMVIDYLRTPGAIDGDAEIFVTLFMANLEERLADLEIQGFDIQQQSVGVVWL